jgi:hypothetical protein
VVASNARWCDSVSCETVLQLSESKAPQQEAIYPTIDSHACTCKSLRAHYSKQDSQRVLSWQSSLPCRTHPGKLYSVLPISLPTSLRSRISECDNRHFVAILLMFTDQMVGLVHVDFDRGTRFSVEMDTQSSSQQILKFRCGCLGSLD